MKIHRDIYFTEESYTLQLQGRLYSAFNIDTLYYKCLFFNLKTGLTTRWCTYLIKTTARLYIAAHFLNLLKNILTFLPSAQGAYIMTISSSRPKKNAVHKPQKRWIKYTKAGVKSDTEKPLFTL